MTELGAVVIGRNEGERLIRCLRSVCDVDHIVYVDSGSTDGSVEAAIAACADVVVLDTNCPFTAARARNAGRARLPATAKYIQFVDGDCTLQPGWTNAARAALDADGQLAAVFGRRREIAPEASIYNWLCDVEWTVSPGPAPFFGGDVMLRATALDQAGGYPDEMIAGEEPDLAMRLRARGWRIACLPAEMTLHDAAIVHFGQWWRRAVRSGHAYAELARRHPASTLHDYGTRLARAAFWGAVVPTLGLVLLAVALAVGSGWIAGAGCSILVLPCLQVIRLYVRERGRRPPKQALALAASFMLAKPAQFRGAMRFWISRASGVRSGLIEYKR